MERQKYLIRAILQKEKERNIEMQQDYFLKIEQLPKGSLKIREMNGKKYCYLSFRDGQKVINQYAGTLENADKLRQQIEERKHLQQVIKMLLAEYMLIEKMEKIK